MLHWLQNMSRRFTHTILVKYYSNPAYKERVKNLFGKSKTKVEVSDKEIDQLVKDIISKIKVAKYKSDINFMIDIMNNAKLLFCNMIKKFF